MATSNKQTISSAEWEVMSVIWDDHPASAGEIIDRLRDRADWNHRTIRTMLSRLVKKGALRYRRRGSGYLYSPALSREECVNEEGASFVKRVFGGMELPMLVHFVERADLSSEDIHRLKELLNEKENDES